ncbi:MAG: sodium/proline symporter PutP [Clostridia bacterium]|nr:sodium/proline symporter PutP [Clostridia bacterium]
MNGYGELLAFILYFCLVLGVGIFFFIKSRKGNASDYFLGGRKMGSWVAALSASASDMSAWLLMGLPGSILALGMGQVWIAIGLGIGTALSWIFTASRLRRFSIVANDSITIPQYLSNRFLSKSKTLQVICAVVFLVCYAVYAASSFKACGTLFNVVLGLDENIAVYVAAVIIIAYTFLGGFNAVCWTDFFQGLLMIGAILLAPIVALTVIGGSGAMEAAELSENYFNFLPTGKLDWGSISTILSGLGWGLGYFGMPHIMVRFMSIKSEAMVKKSRVIAISWTVLSLIGAAAVGLVGRLYAPELAIAGQETVFIVMVRGLFPSFLAGIMLSAILAASMSTADSQLLVSASAFASDVYLPVIRKNKASEREVMIVSRLVVIVIAIAALLIATNPGSGSIMSLVENAWAGFASAFGPAILLSLFWKRFTYKGACAGIVVGAVVDVLWLTFLTASTGIYEILPGFLLGLVACVVVSLIDKEPDDDIKALFDKAVAFKD